MRTLFCLSFVGVTSLFVSGCSPYKDHFDCKVGQGMMCSSLHKVNKAMDKGQIDVESDGDREDTSSSPSLSYGSAFQVRN